MSQHLKEYWFHNKGESYFKKQLENPYRSTVHFVQWLEELGVFKQKRDQRVADIGAGNGANLIYLSQRFPKVFFTGLELNPDLVSWGNELFIESDTANAEMQNFDLFNFDSKNYAFDGIVSFQTLSWLPEIHGALTAMHKFDADWMAFSSLFYDGPIDCKIEVTEMDDECENVLRKSFYNVYSIPNTKKILADMGYSIIKYIPFNIDIDIEKPISGKMGTYTETLANGKRVQISGPLLMNWYFIFCSKH